jgi:glycerophosphoryl diester phosphodiesterase
MVKDQNNLCVGFLNLAHRGLSLEAPENTIPSFRRALQQGAAGIELDVRMTSDEEVVVIHDHKINRTSTGRGQIKRSTFQYLRKYDFGSWFHQEFRKERIPTLTEVLEAFPEAHVVVEVKARRMEKRLAQILKPHTDRVIVTSFFFSILRNIQNEIPEVNLGVNVGHTFEFKRKLKKARQMGLFSLHIEQRFLNQAICDAVKEQGMVLVPWWKGTFYEERLRELLAMGINGVISDFPARVQAVVSTPIFAFEGTAPIFKGIP